MKAQSGLRETILTRLPLYRRGKVRDLYHLGDRLLIVATDRISAFDVVLPTPIPDKGKILTALSLFWFRFLDSFSRHHLLSTEVEELPLIPEEKNLLQGRVMVVKKAQRIDVECVVRGYLAGSGWREYQTKGEISGIKLPSGLLEAEQLPIPIFTPAIKAETGHDYNISEGELRKKLGSWLTNFLKEKSLILYQKAAEYARSRGIIIADTKFEFGFWKDDVILIDELLTPDSSRFWAVEDYHPGSSPRSFDKQYVRDYLESLNWNKLPPAPELPPEVVEKTQEKYREAYQRITGWEWTLETGKSEM